MECALKPATKLRLHFAAASRFGPPMDDNTRNLITRLTTQVGLMMEDSSTPALTCQDASANG
jgi:hypothetical protein